VAGASTDPASRAMSGDGRGRARVPAAAGARPPGADAPLDAWLGWIDAVHPSEMELGLARVSRVARRLGLARPEMPVVIVGGTNGKGSTVAMLEAIWSAAGYRTGAATSPHVVRFAERMRVAGEEAGERAIVRALARVERGRLPADGGPADTLTYFEFATLASMALFVEAGCDVAIMEVGLGGRLDAVNLWDADCAVLTSIALDHADWLGTDVAVIATEKAAIGRAGRPLIVGEPTPPASLGAFAAAHGIEIVDVGGRPPDALPGTSLPGAHQRRNAGCALAAVRALDARLPVAGDVARAALERVALVARFEERRVDGTPLIVDVAHNPAAAAALADAWRARFGATRAVAVFASLADKDIEGIARNLAPHVECWCCAALEGPRALSLETLVTRVRAGLDEAAGVADGSGEASERPGASASLHAGARVVAAGSVADALATALELASETARAVLVFGSFVTVTAAHAALEG